MQCYSLNEALHGIKNNEYRPRGEEQTPDQTTHHLQANVAVWIRGRAGALSCERQRGDGEVARGSDGQRGWVTGSEGSEDSESKRGGQRGGDVG